MKALVSAVGVVVVVAAAALVWHNLPTPTDLYGPFEVRGRAGEVVQGRAISATVAAAPHGTRRIGPMRTWLTQWRAIGARMAHRRSASAKRQREALTLHRELQQHERHPPT